MGYVGLPLARLFATRYAVVGFDINQKRIAELRNGVDSTLEVEDEILQAVLVKDNPVASRASATGLSGAFRQAQCDSLVAMFFKFWVCCFRFQVLGLWFMVYFGFFDGGVLSTNKKDVFLYF